MTKKGSPMTSATTINIKTPSPQETSLICTMQKRMSQKKILMKRLPKKSNSDRTRNKLMNQPESANTFAISRKKEESENYNAIQKVLPQQNFTESSRLATKAKTRSTEEKENH